MGWFRQVRVVRVKHDSLKCALFSCVRIRVKMRKRAQYTARKICFGAINPQMRNDTIIWYALKPVKQVWTSYD